MPSLTMIVLSISAVVAGPLAVFAPLGMAPLSAVVAAMSLLAVVRERLGHIVVRHPIAQVMILLLAWMATTTVWTFNPGNALLLFARSAFLICGGTALAIMLASLDQADRERLAQAVIAGFALLVFFLAFEFLTGGSIVRMALPAKYAEQPWIYVVVSRGSVFMALMLWPTLLAFHHFRCRMGVVAAIAGAIGIAFLTRHGATKLGVATGLATLASVSYFGRRAVVFIGSVCIALVLSMPLLALGSLSPQSWQAVAERLKLSAVHRLYIWQFVAERVWERPLFGWGFDASSHIPGGNTLAPIGKPLISLHPHNAALQIWLELGAVGTALFALLIAATVLKLARSDADRFTQATATAALATSFAVASLSYGIWQSWWLGSLVLMTVWIAGLAAASGVPRPGAAASRL
ncbi:MAG: O-antigen ligase family protein [Hyphomicrobium sp.]